MKYLLIPLFLFLSVLVSPTQAEEKEFSHKFAVVWDRTTADEDLRKNNLAAQADETLKLWKSGTIENVYMNTKAQLPDGTEAVSIMFFIKADTREDAAKILDEMTFVKKKIATYQLFPVGLLWLKISGDKE